MPTAAKCPVERRVRRLWYWSTLSLFRWQLLDWSRKCCVSFDADRPVFGHVTRGIPFEGVLALPVFRGSYRSGSEAAAAVRTDIGDDVRDARFAERALEGADSRIK